MYLFCYFCRKLLNMKKITLILIVALMPTISFAQKEATDAEVAELTKKAVESLKMAFQVPSDIKSYDNVIWKLFPTINMWTFLKLNTRNGMIFQLQYDVQGKNRMESILNPTILAEGKDAIIGRFTLYPTQNSWTFILLDQIDGRAYQVQWSQDEKKRGIVPIVGVSFSYSNQPNTF